MLSPLSFGLNLSQLPTKLDAADHGLFQYCKNLRVILLRTEPLKAHPHIPVQLVAMSAITCDGGIEELLGIIARLSFRDDSASSQAVLYATLAVASLIRHGQTTETFKLQGKALRALEKSANTGISGSKVVQHVAAGMLLCCFEVGNSGSSTVQSNPVFV